MTPVVESIMRADGDAGQMFQKIAMVSMAVSAGVVALSSVSNLAIEMMRKHKGRSHGPNR